MVILLFVISLLASVVAFLVQNPQEVEVRIFLADLHAPKVALAFFFLFVGAFVMNFLNNLAFISARKILKTYSEKVSELEQDVAAKNRRVADLEHELQDAKARLGESSGEHVQVLLEEAVETRNEP